MNKYTNPVSVVQNGFDESDYLSRGKFHKNKFIISYTGNLYHGKRDPIPIFKAILKLKEKYDLQLNFYGRNLLYLQQIINAMNLQSVVKIHNEISYINSLKIQKNSDLLLLLLWDSEKEIGVYSGKLLNTLGHVGQFCYLAQKILLLLLT